MSDAATGEIRMFAGAYAPEGWAFCDGAQLQITQYAPLYSLIGTTYGGTGQTTFALPDLRGRLPVGMGQLTQGGNYVLGKSGGSETVTLEAANTPVHIHIFNATNAAANSMDPNQALPATVTPLGAVKGLYAPTDAAGVVSVEADPNFLDYAYGSQAGAAPHANVMPSFGVNFIICLNGIYPSRP